jgi:uncharacterized protein
MRNWYLGAGCIAQTVWNELHSFPSEKYIKDYDLVYFDDSDLSYEAENAFIQQGTSLFKGLGVKVEIRNQARVHLWYQNRFGKPLEYLDSSGKGNDVYMSVEDAISTWPTTATSIGVRFAEGKKFNVYAPFGLDDLLNMIVRPNKRGVPEEVYLEKGVEVGIPVAQAQSNPLGRPFGVRRRERNEPFSHTNLAHSLG